MRLSLNYIYTYIRYCRLLFKLLIFSRVNKNTVPKFQAKSTSATILLSLKHYTNSSQAHNNTASLTSTPCCVYASVKSRLPLLPLYLSPQDTMTGINSQSQRHLYKLQYQIDPYQNLMLQCLLSQI